MVRIKYYETVGLLHTDWFTLGPNLITRGVIDTTNNKIYIYEFDARCIFEYQAKNLRDAKAKLKARLVKIGVNFDGEIRRHR